MEPMDVHQELSALNARISAHIAQLRRTGRPAATTRAHAWEAVFDSMHAAQAVLSMLVLLDIDAAAEPEYTVVYVNDAADGTGG